MKLSVVINTKNSAKTLKACLESVKWADEIVIVDMHSTDNTVQIAEKYTKRIFRFKDVGYADPARNYAFNKAKGDWIFIIDSDEEITVALQQLIQKIIGNEIDESLQGEVYAFPRKNLIFGGWLQTAGWWPDHQVRLFKNDSIIWDEKVHSLPKITGKRIEIPADERIAIIHHNYPTIDSFLTRLNRYTSIEVESRTQSTVTASSLLSSFRQELMSRLFQYHGIDGNVRGVGISFLQAMYEITVKMKQWEKQEYTESKSSAKDVIHELQSIQQDLAYWTADWHIQRSSGFTNVYWRIRRKLKI